MLGLLLLNAGPSVWSLIFDADPVVKGVMLVLVAFSLISWAIIIQRFLLLRRAWDQSVAFLDRFHAAVSARSSLDPVRSEANGSWPDSPVVQAFKAGYDEWGELVRGPDSESAVMSNVSRALRRSSSEALTRLERSIPFLASCGSAAPFIGLFGTVWGIMTSFHSLANVNQATIAMVAPGISEALIATAMGLFAAIPAVIGYNRFSNQVDRLEVRYDNFKEEFSSILQRQAHKLSEE